MALSIANLSAPSQSGVSLKSFVPAIIKEINSYQPELLLITSLQNQGYAQLQTSILKELWSNSGRDFPVMIFNPESEINLNSFDQLRKIDVYVIIHKTAAGVVEMWKLLRLLVSCNQSAKFLVVFPDQTIRDEIIAVFRTMFEQMLVIMTPFGNGSGIEISKWDTLPKIKIRPIFGIRKYSKDFEVSFKYPLNVLVKPFKPFAAINKDGDFIGIEVDLLKMVGRKLNMKVNFKLTEDQLPIVEEIQQRFKLKFKY